jgi:hypothetical protein
MSLHSFVYSNLRSVYQTRKDEIIKEIQTEINDLRVKNDELKQELYISQQHYPNRMIRIQEMIHENIQKIKYQQEIRLQQFEENCQGYLEQIQNQSMDIYDIERFYETMGVLYRPNVYLNATKYESKYESKSFVYDSNKYICSICDTPRIFDEYLAYCICPKCGNSVANQRDIRETEENLQHTIQFEYDRMNHLREYLNQIIKAEENVASIPKSVIRGIKRQILRENIKNRAMITPKRIKDWLKRDLKMPKYSEKVYSILFAVCKIRPPKITKQVEAKFYEMFEKIQKPFARHVPTGRVHFFNYGHLLRKFSELLDQRHLLSVFPSLKGTDRIHFQDEIWKKCCQDNGWKYIPSV